MEPQRFSQFSAPGFRVPESILGNFGEPLVHGMSMEDEDVDEENMISHIAPEADPSRSTGGSVAVSSGTVGDENDG